MPGRWRGRGGGFNAGQVRRQFRFFSWEESRPWRGLGWRLLCRAGGAAGEASMPGRWRGRGVHETMILHAVMGTSHLCHQTRLGKPVLIGRARAPWASHQTRLGEPVLIGRARTHQTRLGEPVLIGRARTTCCACSASKVPAWLPSARHLNSGPPPLEQRPPCHLYSGRHFHSGPQRLRLLGAVPARRIYKCHVYLSACSALQVPARHIYLGACSAHLPRCLLGTST